MMDEAVVVSPRWLEARLDDPSVRLVDVRDAWEFDEIGHIPGAVNIPFDRFRDPDDHDRGMLPGSETFGTLLSEAGIQRENTLVAYDDMHGVFAARFYVTAEEYGHPDVRLLNGDYSAWQGAYAVTTDECSVERTTYNPQPRSAEGSPMIDRQEVEQSLDRDVLFVDTREANEFASGHLPGAVRFNWREAVDAETRGLKPPEELAAVLSDHEITSDREIILYCNTARRISHTYVVLRALNYERVSFYEGSLREWLATAGEIETSEDIDEISSIDP